MTPQFAGENFVLMSSYRRTMKNTHRFTSLLPFFGTDYGLCTLIKPQITFDKKLEAIPFESLMKQYTQSIEPGIQLGKENGLSILLDTEVRWDWMSRQMTFEESQKAEEKKLLHIDDAVVYLIGLWLWVFSATRRRFQGGHSPPYGSADYGSKRCRYQPWFCHSTLGYADTDRDDRCGQEEIQPTREKVLFRQRVQIQISSQRAL